MSKFDENLKNLIESSSEEEKDLIERLGLKHGQCGFYDEIHEIKGIQYKIGFNFGH